MARQQRLTAGFPLPTNDIRVVNTVRDGVLYVDLANPDRRNAIDTAFVDGFGTALQHVESVRAVVLRSRGADFCVGGDVRAFSAADEPGAYVGALAGALHHVIRTLTESSAVVVAAVRGWATSAGMSLALAADVCLAAQTARFRAAYPAVGLCPDGGLSWTLTRALGGSAALYTILGNRVITAAEPHEMGLIAATCPDDDLDRAVDDFVRQIIAIPAEAVGATKDLISGAHVRDFTAHLDQEAAAIARCAATPASRARSTSSSRDDRRAAATPPPGRVGRCRRHSRSAPARSWLCRCESP
jgi:2-(1,2-epoxy-1,2-dihydrophenyl)acetyl-CoA isomerase